MRVFIAGDFHPSGWGIHEDAWARGLRELGHEVHEFRISSIVSEARFQYLQTRLACGPMLGRINARFVAAVREAKPDVVLCYRTLLLYPETIAELRSIGHSVLVCYQNDSVFGPLGRKTFWRHFRRALPHYDLCLVFRPVDVERYLAAGARRARVLFHYYVPWIHRPLPDAELDGWKSDICCVGHCEPDRRIEQLDLLMRNLRCDYRIHGWNWRRYEKGKAWENTTKPNLIGDDYAKVLNGAKIALAFFSTWNEDVYTTRSFEIPACGTCMLSQRTETIRSLYDEDKEAVFFSSAEELVDKARFYLDHAEARKRIAAGGHRRCTSSGYDIHSRMKQWLAWTEELR